MVAQVIQDTALLLTVCVRLALTPVATVYADADAGLTQATLPGVAFFAF